MDLISELPDYILLYVLSSLTLKEVIMTSVLSKRWKHMWKYHTILNFGSPKLVMPISSCIRLVEVEKHMYFNMVNKVVNSHKAPTIDEFRVRVGLDLIEEGSSSSSSTDKSIDNWFRFAMEKRVKRLEIDLFPPIRGDSTRHHTFPSLSLCNTLTFLKLRSVDIDGKILESFLCNCRALEYLSVKRSTSLVHLKVCGPSLNLKYLTIHSCYEMRGLVISAPKLESFCYCGPEIEVQFKSTPKLVEVSVGAAYADGFTNICLDISSYLSQIEIFKIDNFYILNYRLEKPVLFAKLKKLVMSCLLYEDDDLYYFTSVIKACPLLQHFKLKLYMVLVRKESYPYSERELLKWEACTHYHLKTVEIIGFIGYPIDLEFIAYLVENAPSLNKIIADTRQPGHKKPIHIYFATIDKQDRRRRERDRAELIRANLRPNTKLEIL